MRDQTMKNDLSLHSEVLGMNYDKILEQFVVYVQYKTTAETLETFKDMEDAIRFMVNHELPIDKFDKWLWDIR